jgi:NADPH:quinone reductase-like Zn-dependent oxidoreductase
MKAAVIYQAGAMPEYTDVDEPIVRTDDELLITVKAAAIKHLDRGIARGTHYSAEDKTVAKIPGGDGVGVLADGTRVYSMGTGGMLAEKAIIEKDRMVKLPASLDYATAAAMANAVIGSAMGLRFKADIQAGDVVLVNGATGFTGKMAVQIAKHYGAKKVVATGRNEQSLQALLSLGADEIISLKQSDENILSQLKEIHKNTPIDVIIDYVWGHTAEMILATLKGKGSFTNKIRYVSIGAMSGDLIQLSAANLRSVDLQLSGSGLGSWPKEQVRKLFTEILPEMFQLAADGKLKVDTISVPLKDIGKLWDMEVPSGKRIVVIP